MKGAELVRLSSIRVVTDDVLALAGFYEKLLGVTAVGYAEYMELQTPGATLAICSQRSVQATDAGSLAARSNRSAVLEFEVGDVDAEYVGVRSIVTDWVLEPTQQQWGNRSMLFRDPDGNLINVYSPASLR